MKCTLTQQCIGFTTFALAPLRSTEQITMQVRPRHAYFLQATQMVLMLRRVCESPFIEHMKAP